MTLDEKVKVTLEVEDKNAKKRIDHFNKALSATKTIQKKNTQQTEVASNRWRRFRQNIKGFNTTMGLSGKQFGKASTDIKSGTSGINEFNNKGARFANNIRGMAHGLRGFRMEMLGVMFFGMAMSKMFSGLLKPSLETVGVFQLLKETLTILFLPIAIKVFGFFAKLLEFVSNLSPETKLMIGKFVLFGLAIGTVLFLIGTLALGIGSIILAFSGFFTIIDKLIPDVEAFGVNLSSIFEVGLGVGLLGKAFSFIKDKITDLKSFLKESDMFGDFFTKIDEKWQKIKDELNLNLDDLGLTGEGGMIESFQTFASDLTTDVVPAILEMTEALESISITIDDLWSGFQIFLLNVKIGFKGMIAILLTSLGIFLGAFSDLPIFGNKFASASKKMLDKSATVTKEMNTLISEKGELQNPTYGTDEGIIDSVNNQNIPSSSSGRGQQIVFSPTINFTGVLPTDAILAGVNQALNDKYYELQRGI